MSLKFAYAREMNPKRSIKVDLVKEKEREFQSQSKEEGASGEEDSGSEEDSQKSSYFGEDDDEIYAAGRKRQRKEKKSKKVVFARKLLTLEEVKGRLSTRIVGQSMAIEMLAPTFTFIQRRVRVPKEANQRVYTILLAGPTGTGKTEFTLSVRSLFGCAPGQELSYLVVKEDMGTVHDASHFNKYTGVGSGYAGYGDKTLITHFNDAITTFKTKYGTEPPYLFLILDEIDKASHGVYNIFNSLFDKGEMSGGSEKFCLPSKTFLVILCTSNYGTMNNSLKPSTSIDLIKKEMLKRKLDPCDIGRMRMIVPFFELSEEHRRKIATNLLKNILLEYGHHKKLSPTFVNDYTNYLMCRSQKDSRSMEKELVDAFDAIFLAHECRYGDSKNNFLLHFQDADVVDHSQGDFRKANRAHHAEYMSYINEAQENGNTSLDPMIPCIVLKVNATVYQVYILPFNQFHKVSYPQFEEEMSSSSSCESGGHHHHHHQSSSSSLSKTEIESFRKEKEDFELTRKTFEAENAEVMDKVKTQMTNIKKEIDDLNVTVEKFNSMDIY